MGAAIQYAKAQLKRKLNHPVKNLILFILPLFMFLGCYMTGKNWKREQEAKRVSFYGILMTVATLSFYLLYTFTTAYDIIRERQVLRKQHQLANGLGNVKFYWGWIFVYSLLMLPTCIAICVIVSVLNVFPAVGFVPIFVDFFLFQVTGITVAFWVGSYVPVALIGAIIVTIFNMSFTGAYFGMAYMPDNIKEILCLFVSPMTIGGIINNFQLASIRNTPEDQITAFNLIPTRGGKYSVFSYTFKLIFNNILYVSFACIFEKLYIHLNRNKGELKKKEYYENEVKKDTTKIQSAKKEGAVISVQNAFKTFFNKKAGDAEAVKNVSFEVYKNEIFAIAGKEGSGKTTVMKMLGGRILPSYGDVQVMNSFGKDQTQCLATVGSVAPQDDYTVFEESTVAQNIDFYKTITKSNAKPYDLLNELNFKGKKGDLYNKLDAIEKSKVKIVIALICNKPIALFDEPTTGMTEKDAESFWNVIEAHREGKTIIVSTNSVAEAEEHADRVLVLENGSVKCIGEVEYVKKNVKLPQSELQVKVEC